VWKGSSGGGGLGYDQTWQDVTGQRSFGTTYLNDTGKPILVRISGNTSGGGTIVIALYVNGAYTGLGLVVRNSGGGNYFGGTEFTVPNNSNYMLSCYQCFAASVNGWHELR